MYRLKFKSARRIDRQWQPRLLWKHQKNDADDNDHDEYQQCFRLVYFRSATNSRMSKLSINIPVAPMQSSAIRGNPCSNFWGSWKVGRYMCGGRTLNVFINSRHQSSLLLEALKPFSQFTFTKTPLVTDFESRHLFALDQTQNGSAAQSQHVSGLLDCHQTHGINIVFHRGKLIEQRRCHCPTEYRRAFLGKSGRLGK